MKARRRWHALVVLALAAVVAVVFSFGITDGHIGLDDWGYTGGCPFVRDGLTWDNVCRAFCDVGYGAIWMPVTFMSYMADVSLFACSWKVHHAVNVALHLLNFAIVVLFFERMLAHLSDSPRRTIWLASVIAALLWAVHPMRADAVSYVASRKEELWTLFALAGLVSYLRFLEGGGARHYIASFAAFALACMSKPTAVAFPCIAAAMHVLPGVENRGRRLLCLLPMLLVSIAVGLVALHSQAHPAGALEVGLYDAALSWRLLNAAVSLGLYLYHTVVPAGIHIDYLAVFGGWPRDAWLGIGVLAFAVALSAVAFAKSGARGRAALAFAAMAFLLSAGPTLGVLGYVNGDQAMADRYAYFPHVALFLLVACLIVRFANTAKTACVAGALALAAFVLECAIAVPVVKSYGDGFSAYSRALAKDPGHWRALRIVGNEYCARLGRCREGVEMLRNSLAARKSKATADSLAYVLALKGTPGDFAEVKRLCAEASRSPQSDKGGMMLDALGIVSMRENDFSSAARFLAAGLRASARNHSPDYSLLWLGASLANIGAGREAASAFARARASQVMYVRRRAEEAIALMKGGWKGVFDWKWANGD